MEEACFNNNVVFYLCRCWEAGRRAFCVTEGLRLLPLRAASSAPLFAQPTERVLYMKACHQKVACLVRGVGVSSVVKQACRGSIKLLSRRSAALRWARLRRRHRLYGGAHLPTAKAGWRIRRKRERGGAGRDEGAGGMLPYLCGCGWKHPHLPSVPASPGSPLFWRHMSASRYTPQNGGCCCLCAVSAPTHALLRACVWRDSRLRSSA